MRSINAKWIPELAAHRSKLKRNENPLLVLVATKIDLRDSNANESSANDSNANESNANESNANESSECIPHARGSALAREIGAAYFECSALRLVGITDIFNHVTIHNQSHNVHGAVLCC